MTRAGCLEDDGIESQRGKLAEDGSKEKGYSEGTTGGEQEVVGRSWLDGQKMAVSVKLMS